MLRIGAAPAQIARKRLSYLHFGGIRILVEKGFRGNNKARGAVAALQGMMFDIGIDQRMMGCCNPLNGLYALPSALNGQQHA